MSARYDTGNGGYMEKVASNVYSKAVSLGCSYIRGWGKASKDGQTWLTRFSEKGDNTGKVVFVGWDGEDWIIENED